MKHNRKDTTGDLTANLTGGQVQSVLDFLILESLSPIIRNSVVFDLQVAHLLALVTRNKKRKISALGREEVSNTLCKYLMTEDTSVRVVILAGAKIERAFFYSFVVNFLKEVEGYTAMYQQFLVESNPEESHKLDKKLQVIEKSVCVHRSRLYSTINMCRDFLEKAYEFRNEIVQNYMRHAYKQAKAYCSQKGANFDFEDVYQNLLTAVTKGVDKYDSSLGAMTSYINFWILNAMTSNLPHGHEYGIAYSMPQARKKELAMGGTTGGINFSVSLEQEIKNSEEPDSLMNHLPGAEGEDKKIERAQEINLTRRLIKLADIRGIFRLYYDIDEIFFHREVEKMKKTMLEQRTETVNLK